MSDNNGNNAACYPFITIEEVLRREEERWQRKQREIALAVQQGKKSEELYYAMTSGLQEEG